jgi:hypothetical protein
MNSNITEELNLLEEQYKHLDEIRNLNVLLVDRLKEKEQIILQLTEELMNTKHELLYYLQPEFKNMEDKLNIKEEQIEFFKQEKLTFELDKQENYTMCCNEDYNENRICKIRPIDKNGNMKLNN